MEVLVLCLLPVLFCYLSHGLVFARAFHELIYLLNPGTAHYQKQVVEGGEKQGFEPGWWVSWLTEQSSE